MKDWQKKAKEIIEKLADRYFAHDKKMYECVKKHPLSMLMASLPFLAASKKPEMYAALNLGILVNGSLMKEYFKQQKGDTLKSRMKILRNFDTPQKPKLIEKAFLLMELISLEDHKIDAAEDKKKGFYNPINDGLDYEREKNGLIKKIKGIKAPEIDDIITIDDVGNVAYPWWFC